MLGVTTSPSSRRAKYSSRPLSSVAFVLGVAQMTATAASTNICLNTKCGASVKDGWRRGWRLRSGDIAKLCDRCGYAYEQVRFCEDFHSDTTGWRNCGTCGKLLHCGCIASVDAMLLLDTGGVECIACAKKNGLNVDCNKVLDMEHPSSCSMENKVLEDLFRKDVAGGFKPPCQKIDNINLEVYKSLGVSVEEYMCSLKVSSHVKRRQIQETGTGALIDELEVKKHVNGLNCDPAVPGHNVIPQSTSLKRNSSIAPDLSKSFQQKCATSDSTRPNGSLVQRQRPVQFSSNQYSPILNANLQASREIENHISIARNNVEGRPRNQTILSRYWPRITGQELQQISGDSNSNIIPLFEKTLSASDAGRIGRLVLPKKCAETYFPTISHPEGLPLKIQDANGKEWIFQFRFWPNNNSRMYVLEGVTSCIQSMQLQAGDVVTFSRINPEGKLLMGFRKASTVIPDQDIQLVENPQNVGEISSRIAGCNEVVTALSAYSSVGTVEPIQDSPNKQTYSSDVCSVEKATGDLKGLPVLLDKKKSGNVGPKKRRFCVVTNDFIKLKLQWNEAQGYLQPPPNYSPSIVVIGGHEFEEYEEPPILGKQALITEKEIRERAQWVQCVNCSKWRKVPGTACLPPTWVCSDNAWDPERSSCSSAQEISTEQLEELSSKLVQKSPQVTKKRKRKETPTKLDELADLALLDGNELHPPMQPPTTRHPRHRDGCSCIVCIQPPSGQGPKHEPSCTCNVCLTVKRRFRTLMLRRKKLQSEKVTENAQRNYQESPRKNIDFEVTESDKPQQCNPSTRDSDVSVKASDNSELLPLSLADKGEGPNIGKGQIDLNSHPEDFSPHSGSASMLRPFHDSMWMGVQCSSVGGDEDTDVRAIDTFDKSNVSNGDHVFKPGSLYTDTIGGSEVTDFSAQAPETSAM